MKLQHQRCLLVLLIMTIPAVAYAAGDRALREAWKAYCSGESSKATELLDKVIGADKSTEFDAAYLRSRIAASEFVAYFHESKRTGQPLAKRRDELSAGATKAYEAAFRAAPDQYTRACITAEWWSLYAGYQFRNSSALLMQGSPRALALRMPPSLASRIESQEKIFRAVFRGTLDGAPTTKNMKNDTKDAFARSFAGEFKSFAVVNMPDAAFADLLRHLPVFVVEYMPDVIAIPNVELVRNTMRWHLWGAMTRMRPNEVEQEIIRQETTAYAEKVGKSIEKGISHPAVKSRGEHYSRLFMRTYVCLKDNPFVPYFKRCIPKYEVLKRRELLDLNWGQVTKNWRVDVAGWKTDRMPVPDSTYSEAAKRYQVVMYSLAWTSFTHYRQPVGEGQIPGEYIVRSGASLKPNMVWTFTVQKVIDWPRKPEQAGVRPKHKQGNTVPLAPTRNSIP